MCSIISDTTCSHIRYYSMYTRLLDTVSTDEFYVATVNVQNKVIGTTPTQQQHNLDLKRN